MKRKFSWRGASAGLFVGLFCMMLVYCVGEYAYGKDPCSSCMEEKRICAAKVKEMPTSTYKERERQGWAHTACEVNYGKCVAECIKTPSNNKGGEVIQK